jgi:hypothetical protein
LKDTLFNIGVGKFGKYSHCVWQTDEEGQFKPLSESSPVIGNINQISKVKEIKLEFYCDGSVEISKIISTLKSVHPYETPAYGVVKLEQGV